MPSADYVTVDVFTEERFTGNPLAVIPDARGLTARQMQQIATEFNYSESTFVLPPEDSANTARVRIFTPTTEIPFAGHPNVGTAFVIGQFPELFGKPLGDRLCFEETAGLVDVDLVRAGGAVVGATIRAPRQLEIGDTIDAHVIAGCASLDPSQVLTRPQRPVVASVGLPFAIAELTDLDALAAARPDLSAFHEAAALHPRQGGDFSLFLYVRNRERAQEIRGRMFAPLDNVAEDPATGSASAALGALLATADPRPDEELRFIVEQGVEMGRRSVIELTLMKSKGEVTDVRVTGRCVFAMRGSVAY